jgi:hypothetical protein
VGRWSRARSSRSARTFSHREAELAQTPLQYRLMGSESGLQDGEIALQHPRDLHELKPSARSATISAARLISSAP